MILAGDIGGTKTVVALFDETGGALKLVRDATYPSRENPTFEGILDKFLAAGERVPLKAGCFGVAGPVINGTVKTTNLPWTLDESDLSRTLSAPRVKLLNDLEAAAYGMLFLRSDELCALNTNARPRSPGNVAVIAAGTGLGEAMLYWDGKSHHPLASEGGHVEFAPQSDQEIELLRYLRGKFNGHVSYERILSGPGFYNVFCFLRDSGIFPESPLLKERLASGGDPSVVVTQLGLAGGDPLCEGTIEMFLSIYGAEAGNLALKCVATGGVFVGGGIAPKMLSAVQKGTFLQAFVNKGRFGDLLRSLEVNVSLNPRAPLIGAANYAARLAS